MAYPVIWSDRALDQIDPIGEYIGRSSPWYARAVVQRILAMGRQLEDFPFAGQRVPEAREPTFRQVLVHSYRIIYRTQADSVTVVAVIHGRRRLHPEELT